MTQINAVFDSIGKHITINKNKKIITHSSDEWEWNTGYISLVIEPNQNNTYIAKFKIIKCGGAIMIGIECNNWNSQNDWFIHGGNNAYGYYSYNGNIYSHNDEYGKKYLDRYDDNDEIVLKLEFLSVSNSGKLYYSKNGSDFKDTKYKIPKKQKIKIAVSLLGGGIELLSMIKKENNNNNNNDNDDEKMEIENNSSYELYQENKQLKKENSEMSKQINLWNGKSEMINTLNLEQLNAEFEKHQNVINKINRAKEMLFENSLKCMICFENNKNVVINGCNHCVICNKCEQQLPSKVCPRCTKPFQNTTIIHL